MPYKQVEPEINSAKQEQSLHHQSFIKDSNMEVWIITMIFPGISETFASNDVHTMRNAGLKVAIHGLRPTPKLFSKLVVERGISDIWTTHNSLIYSLQGLWIGCKNPLILIDFMVWIFKHSWKRPINLFKSLILVPRSLQIYDSARQHNPDIVHLYWSHFPSLVGYLIQNYLPKTVVTISFVAHDIYNSEFQSQDSYTGDVARNADLVHTITADNIPAIEKYGIPKEQILLSYHGIDFRKIPEKKAKIKRRIVTAGRLIPEKGFSDTLKAFKQVLEQYPDASLIVLGDGPERKNLQALAQSLNISHAVDFRGFVTHNEIFQEMALAEIFLFMSFYKAERLPNVVKEAIACQCLCVISHTPGIEELISDKVHGYIVPQHDIDTAAKLIQQAFSNPEQMNQINEAAYQHLRKNFDIEQIIAELQQRWFKLLTEKKDSDLGL
ncbi:glycosyltransferase family 4 protein [Calothrix sp. UHCC 0171]|uniref:glycosyltransferase family 4 protein n=1 Tax=Calothrix sp. UHCC 0171 TaxID=3110245 RepID=UPI002B2016D8|nr:glycosyltransferase family 4 protein [Calothrix sp. UHCC 0171]MEA5571820.1 glycosyltransferase family 4 protein [Calothrix sp. UHCC 0171]